MKTFLQDMRYAFRMFLKAPGFTGIAILTLAIGIGANTAIFAVVNAVLLKPLPYPEPEQVLILSENSPQFSAGSVAYPNFEDWKAQNQTFSQMAAFRTEGYTLSGTGAAEHLRGREVSAGMFSLLGVQPILGREFQAEEDKPGAPHVAVLSYGLWKNHFASDPTILGKPIRLSDQDYTVVGVLPERFWFYTPAEVFVPIGNETRMWRNSREMRSGVFVVGRMKPGARVEQARADMKQIGAQLAAAYPKGNAGHGVTVTPMLEDVVGDVRKSLYLLLGAVGLVLLIACVNVANLLLVRANSRRKEIAIRSAMGSSRWRVIRQLLTESVTLSLMGGIAGYVLANWGTAALAAAVPGSLPRSAQGIHADESVLLFTFGISMLTGILFGLAPGLRAADVNLIEVLKQGVRGTTGRRHRLQDALVVAEIGLALVLLVGAGLTLRSILELHQVQPGFDASHAMTFEVSISAGSYPTPVKVRAYVDETLRQVEAVPGVRAASLTTDVPIRDDSEIPFYVAGRAKPTDEEMPWSMLYIVTKGYAEAMGLQVVKGRFLTEKDGVTAQNVVVIDTELASKMFPDGDAIGRSVVFPFPGIDQPREIVGVVNHVRHWGLAQDSTAKIRSQIYTPFAQIPDAFLGELSTGSLSFVARTEGEPMAMTGAIRAAIQKVDKDQPVYGFTSLQQVVSDSLATLRFSTLLFGAFAGIAVLLAAVGIYGVMAYIVSQRTNEIGIRLAMGASRGEVMRMILRYGTVLSLLGAAVGLGVSVAFTRLLGSLLYGVKPIDPVTFGAVTAILVGVAIAACCIPARRATSVDPQTALRYE